MATDKQIQSNSAKKKAKKELEQLNNLASNPHFDKETFENKSKQLSYPELIDLPLDANGVSGYNLLHSLVAAQNPLAITLLFNLPVKPDPCAQIIGRDKKISTPIWAALINLDNLNRIPFIEDKKKLGFELIAILMIRNMRNVTEIIGHSEQANILHALCALTNEAVGLKLAREVFKKTTPQEKTLLFSQRNADNNTPNEYVIRCRRPKLLELFLAESDNQAKSHILRFAATNKDFYELIKIILKFINVDDRDPTIGETALHRAAYSGNSNAVATLLSHGANPNIRNYANLAPSEMARSQGYFAIAQTLEARMDTLPQRTVESDLLQYIAKGDLQAIKRIINKENINICLPKEKCTPLYMAAQENQIDIVRFLIQAGANINEKIEVGFPLFIAIERGHIEVVRLLVSAHTRADLTLTQEGFTALHVATQNGHPNIVRLLCENGADVLARTPQTLTPLLIAAQKGHTPCIEALLEFSPEKQIDQLTSDCPQTALHYAVLNQDLPSVKALCRKNPNVAIKNSNGVTPFVAAIKTSSKIINLLLPHVKDYKAHCCDPSSVVKIYPLHFSILSFDYSFSRKLILKFPECITIASRIDGKEYLPIESAILFKNYPAIRLLLQHGAKLTHALGQQMRDAKDIEFNKILEEYSTENVTEAKSVTPTVPLQEKISTRSYLASLGFDDKEIEAMRRSNQEKFAKKINFWNAPSKTEKPKTYTWFNKNLKSDDIKSIDSAIKCFYNLDTDALRQQKCPEHIIKLFENQLPKFSPQHLKKINLDMTFQIEGIDVKPTHELWIPGIPDRVLVFQIPSDDKSASLYYGCLYLPNGLHETADMKSLLAQSKNININMDQKKFISSNSTA